MLAPQAQKEIKAAIQRLDNAIICQNTFSTDEVLTVAIMRIANELNSLLISNS